MRLMDGRVSGADKAYKVAIKEGFGCKQCLVVSDTRDNLYKGDEKLPESYWEKLQDQEYHPGTRPGTVTKYSFLDFPVGGKKDARKKTATA